MEPFKIFKYYLESVVRARREHIAVCLSHEYYYLWQLMLNLSLKAKMHTLRAVTQIITDIAYTDGSRR